MSHRPIRRLYDRVHTCLSYFRKVPELLTAPRAREMRKPRVCRCTLLLPTSRSVVYVWLLGNVEILTGGHYVE